MIYIHKKQGFYISEPLDLESSYYVGKTLEYYNNGAYLALGDKQIAFHTVHPGATQMEVWRMELAPVPDPPILEPVPEPDLLVIAKQKKIWQIMDYDRSDAVNSFIVNRVSTWLTPEVRANYKNSIESAGLLGETEITFIIANIPATSTLLDARLMLAKIQRYADKCTIRTEMHKVNVLALTTVEAVGAYDHAVGYPVKEEFTLTNRFHIP